MAFKFQTICHQTNFVHLNTVLVWYSDPHCGKKSHHYTNMKLLHLI